jgi:RHS repeat-associated protein
VAAAWTAGAKMDLYCNGFKVDRSSTTIDGPLDAFSGSNLTIGTRLVGKIDEVVVRNVIPSSFSVDANYGSAPSGTLALWHFGEGSGTTAADSSGSSHTATVSSSSWSNATGELKPAEYEMRYGYDKVGNRTTSYKFLRGASPSSDLFVSIYNGLNQLTEKTRYLTNWTTLQDKWVYTYDYNGNLTQAQKQNSSGTQLEKWNYTWNPRDQMTSAERRTGTGTGTYAGRVEYQYCLSCDGAMSERKEFDTSSSTSITSWRRYEYDGLNLLRVDDKYDSNGNGYLDSGDTLWRKAEVNTHRPGALGALIGKRVYTYSSGTTGTPSGQNDFTYTYDAVGNVVAVYNANSTNRGNEVDYFTQDAFGNELSVGSYAGTAWSTARSAGIWEHQTGKWVDPMTGLYYFQARWCDSGVGRFVNASPIRLDLETPYVYVENSPLTIVDYSGLLGRCTEEEAQHSLTGLRNALEAEVALINSWPYWQRPSGCTSWSQYLQGAGQTYLSQQPKRCWDSQLVAGFALLYDPRSGTYFLGTRHQVTEYRKLTCEIKDWEDRSNIVFDAWTESTPLTGKGSLKQYTMGVFRSRYPVHTGTK